MMLYATLPGQSKIWSTLHDLALNESSEYVEHYGFNVLQVPEEIMDKDWRFEALRKRYPFVAGITKMQPYNVYNWHTDAKRSGTINMMIDHESSHCLFTTDTESRVSGFQELIYRHKTYYIFNTQVPHMVVNLEGNRFMLTLEFRDTVTCQNLYDFFEERK
jgi:hypothetical protein